MNHRCWYCNLIAREHILIVPGRYSLLENADHGSCITQTSELRTLFYDKPCAIRCLGCYLGPHICVFNLIKVSAISTSAHLCVPIIIMRKIVHLNTNCDRYRIFSLMVKSTAFMCDFNFWRYCCSGCSRSPHKLYQSTLTSLM
jgi:hypothetical protein